MRWYVRVPFGFAVLFVVLRWIGMASLVGLALIAKACDAATAPSAPTATSTTPDDPIPVLVAWLWVIVGLTILWARNRNKRKANVGGSKSPCDDCQRKFRVKYLNHSGDRKLCDACFGKAYREWQERCGNES